jgi:hypothetical protein
MKTEAETQEDLGKDGKNFLCFRQLVVRRRIEEATLVQLQ